ncbi:MAG: hypothetical protein JO332_18455 [Planctomycetaceae bacterium]|nr:hypothetical protein [Planctomycetaceae bacterium]
MAQRTVRCGCGADFPIPAIPPATLHCPRCGERLTFASAAGGAVRVREDVREPVRPLPPRNPYYPLVLLCGAGLLIAAGLVALTIHYSVKERSLSPIADEGIRARQRPPKEEEPLISIRAIPPTPELPPPPLPAPPPAPKEAPKVPPTPPGRARDLGIHANLAGLVSTALRLSGRIDDARDLQALVVRDHEELSELDDRNVRPDCFNPGDEIVGFAAVGLDPQRPELLAEAIREWLSEARPGALVLATVRRDAQKRTLTFWFPDLDPALLQKLPPAGRKVPK